MKFKLYLIIILITSVSACKSLPLKKDETNFKGITVNTTISRKATFTLQILENNIDIQWDNVSLYGKANLKRERESYDAQTNTYSKVYEGSFDCSSVGGWAPNTNSPITVTVIFSKTNKPLFGDYIIKGKGKLLKQEGVLFFNCE